MIKILKKFAVVLLRLEIRSGDCEKYYNGRLSFTHLRFVGI